MLEHLRPRSILRLACLSFLALASLAFFAACSGGPDDPPPASKQATLDDFKGVWITDLGEGTYTITINNDPVDSSRGVFDAPNAVASGYVTVRDGIATLNEKIVGQYSSTPPEKINLWHNAYVRSSGSPGSIAGTWTANDGGISFTLTIEMTSATSGTFASTVNGNNSYSGTCAYDAATADITLTSLFGSAELNEAKDTMTLSRARIANAWTFRRASP